MGPLELWGGHECTLNRVGDAYFDQTVLSGHETRPDDIGRFATLGLKRLRYPALWERTERTRGVLDWAWLDERLSAVRAAGMAPILGLLHHGSGPAWTSLPDEDFATGLADYAGAVAQRFPWVDAYTPVNEPLTTARFSCRYGHWYPHRRDDRSMWSAFLNQIDATRLAMRAIRKVNPAAKLVQTEDLGRCQSTPTLAYQAEFENERRWLTWDLLSGRVDPDHPMHPHLSALGFADRLARIADDPCPPDVIGVNHYPTSERFLDHEAAQYAPDLVGTNGRHRYADVEAVRVSKGGVCGFEPLLEEAWNRYGRPVAITECHLGCTREEQLRWLVEAWNGALRLRRDGCEVVAVTAWALLGSHNWNTLLTRQGRYESGAFDLRGGRPRATALVKTLQALADGTETLALAAAPGWWRREDRLTLGRAVQAAQVPARRPSPTFPEPGESRPILITGATGTLGRAFARACTLRGLPFHLSHRAEIPIADRDRVDAALLRIRPWAVINTAGWVRVDDAEAHEEACFADNAVGPAVLAASCAAADVAFVTFSSDLVFDGVGPQAYLETDDPRPLNVYGRSKLQGERAVTQAGGRSLIVRTAAFFQEADQHNFAVQTLASLADGRPVKAAEDLTVSPTYVPDLVEAVLDLLIDGETGLWHLANPGAVTWCEFARRLAVAAGLDPHLIVPRPASTFGWAAPRPKHVALGSDRAVLLPPLDDAIKRFIAGRLATQPAMRAAALSADEAMRSLRQSRRSRKQVKYPVATFPVSLAGGASGSPPDQRGG